MEAWLKILIGLGFLFLSLGYLYRPSFVLRLNAWGRSLIFNDGDVLLYRRRRGLLLFAAAVLFLYSGFHNLARLRAVQTPSPYFRLWDAQRAYRGGDFAAAAGLCQEVIRHEPENVHAWALLGSSWSALGKTHQAKKAWAQVMKLNPHHPALDTASPAAAPPPDERRS